MVYSVVKDNMAARQTVWLTDMTLEWFNGEVKKQKYDLSNSYSNIRVNLTQQVALYQNTINNSCVCVCVCMCVCVCVCRQGTTLWGGP